MSRRSNGRGAPWWKLVVILMASSSLAVEASRRECGWRADVLEISQAFGDVGLSPQEALRCDSWTAEHWHDQHCGVESLKIGVERCGGQSQRPERQKVLAALCSWYLVPIFTGSVACVYAGSSSQKCMFVMPLRGQVHASEQHQHLVPADRVKGIPEV